LDMLVEREQYYLDLLNPFGNNGYNLLKDSNFGGWTGQNHTDESKKKMSEKKKNYVPWNKGKTGVQICSDETRSKFSEQRRGENNSFYGKSHSDETKEILKNYAKNRDMSHCNKKVIQKDKISKDIIKIWDSISDASEQVLGVRKSSRISAACRGKYKTAAGFIWEYL